jgi:hypothetical protein
LLYEELAGFSEDRQEKQRMLTSSINQYPGAVFFFYSTKSYIIGQGSHLDPIRAEGVIKYIIVT